MFESLSRRDLLKKAKAAVERARNADARFVKNTRKAFRYTDDVQWDKDKLDLMKNEDRTARTFNLIRRRVDLVMGVSEDVRVRYYLSPVEHSDSFLCEVLGSAAEWMMDQYKVYEICSGAKESAAICGRGWTAVDLSPDPKRLGFIKLNVSNVSPYDVKKDPASRANDLSDASYVVWDRWLTVEDFNIMFPKHAKHVQTVMQTDMMFDEFAETVDTESDSYSDPDDWALKIGDYNTPLDIHYYDKTKNRVRFIHLEYWQSFKRYYREDQETGEFIEFDIKNKKTLEKIYTDVYNTPFDYFYTTDKKVKWLQFVGDRILYDGDAPVDSNGFSIVQTVGFRDASLKTGENYGIVKLLIDPQDEVNERWSQTGDWIAKSVQTGVYAETDAFVDNEMGEDSLRMKGSVTWLNDGGINKIREREMPRMPTAPIQMEQMAQNLIDKISGINPDLMGTDRGRSDSGVVVGIRREQGLKLLTSLLKNFNLAGQQVYERVVNIITQWMPESQLASILGDQGKKYRIQDGVVYDLQYGQQAEIRKLKSLQYNIKTEQRPGNKTLDMIDLSIFLEMQQYGIPVDPFVLIDKTSLTLTQKEQWKAYIEQQKQQEAEAAKRQYELEMAKISADQQQVAAKIQSAEGMGMAKLAEAKRKGNMKHISDADERAIKRRGQELDFIARNEQIREQQRSNPA